MASTSSGAPPIPGVDQVWRGSSGEWAIVKAFDGDLVTLSIVGAHPRAKRLRTDKLLKRWKLFAPLPPGSH